VKASAADGFQIRRGQELRPEMAPLAAGGLRGSSSMTTPAMKRTRFSYGGARSWRGQCSATASFLLTPDLVATANDPL